MFHVGILCGYIFADFSAGDVVSSQDMLPGATIVRPTKLVVRSIVFLALSALFLSTLSGIACQSESQAAAPLEGDGALTVAATGITGSQDN